VVTERSQNGFSAFQRKREREKKHFAQTGTKTGRRDYPHSIINLITLHDHRLSRMSLSHCNAVFISLFFTHCFFMQNAPRWKRSNTASLTLCGLARPRLEFTLFHSVNCSLDFY